MLILVMSTVSHGHQVPHHKRYWRRPETMGLSGYGRFYQLVDCALRTAVPATYLGVATACQCVAVCCPVLSHDSPSCSRQGSIKTVRSYKAYLQRGNDNAPAGT